ncbi:MAG: hypothetical protein M1818_005122 [Claussenomyces sp. TS43310]|nr:MAG: hypothetical protein M1818_005122 [Claussenomyces sp. TS43310]
MENGSSRSLSSSPEISPLSMGDDIAPLPTYKVPSTTSIDFSCLLSPPLKIHEDLTSGCGGQLWPAGIVLATHLLRHCRQSLKEAKILELGAGGGVTGLAVTIGCSVALPSYITDQENMMPLMKQNVALNELSSRVQPLVLNWGDPLPKAIRNDPPTHILAADCVYFEPAFPLLMQTMTSLLELTPDAVIYFCFKKRRRADMQFLKTARRRFHVVEVEDDDRAVWERQGLFLVTFQSKK